MKRVMILGAGIYQVPLIKKAKELGLDTIVVSIPGNYPGFKFADKVLYIDTRARDEIYEFAEKFQIDGICTAGTDVAVQTIGYVNDRLGLSGVSQKAAETVTDKLKMKEAFALGNVNTAAFAKICSFEEAKLRVPEFGYPVCLKVVDKSGSRGVLKIENEMELIDGWKRCISITDKSYMLLEEYIEAEEIGVDGFVVNGEIALFLPHKKLVYHTNNSTIPAGHKFPFDCKQAEYLEIEKQINLAVASCGIDNCPFNADVFISGNQVKVIELGARSGATCIPELISIYCGFDYYEKILLSALGDQVKFNYSGTTPCISKLIFSERSGVLREILNDPIMKLEQMGISWKLDFIPGDMIPVVRDGTDRIGHVYMATSDEDKAEYCARLLKSAMVY